LNNIGIEFVDFRITFVLFLRALTDRVAAILLGVCLSALHLAKVRKFQALLLSNHIDGGLIGHVNLVLHNHRFFFVVFRGLHLANRVGKLVSYEVDICGVNISYLIESERTLDIGVVTAHFAAL
jgi:hypothetical protein